MTPLYIKRIRHNLRGYCYKGFAYWRTRHIKANIIVKRLLIRHPYPFTLFPTPIQPYHGIENSLMYQAFLNDSEYMKEYKPCTPDYNEVPFHN